MTTTINNNGTFTTRVRIYQTEKGTVTCKIQHSEGYSIARWSFKPKNDCVAYGNLTKRSMKYRAYK
jgi:predicted GNAT superfamily acetyltransferase